MAVAQSLERQLVSLIIAVYEPPSGKLTADAYDGLLSQLSKQTLGALIKKLKDSFDVPADFDARLQEALRLRNWLTHRYFANRTTEFQSPEGRSEMIRELDEISDRLDELDQYFDHLLVSWLVDPGMRTRKLIIEAFRKITEES
jgi:23S rRNA G2069 N7-methylase RlmK/C1962 C5-methylase RlmI